EADGAGEGRRHQLIYSKGEGMPTFRKLSQEEITAQKSQRRGSIDLSEYLDFLDECARGDWGELKLAEGDKIRTVKRRLSMAARRQQKQIRWRPLRNGALPFEVR